MKTKTAHTAANAAKRHGARVVVVARAEETSTSGASMMMWDSRSSSSSSEEEEDAIDGGVRARTRWMGKNNIYATTARESAGFVWVDG